MATVTDPNKEQVAARPKAADQLPSIRGPRLPYHPGLKERFGIDLTAWKALVEAIFPNATSIESVILAMSYCKARKLDVFKRNVHIVPIWNADQKCYVDTIWPGIGELRTTAFRTGEYAGRDECRFGDDVCEKVGNIEVTYPEWAQITVYRMVKGQRVAFMGPKVWWKETYAVKKFNDPSPNQMWEDRPRGQLEKCAEAAALRAAFPEEVGGDHIPEEVQHSHGGKATPALEHAGAAAGLDAIAERLESERQQATTDVATAGHETAEIETKSDDASEADGAQKPNESATSADPTIAAFAKYKFEIGQCDVIGGLTLIYDRWFGPDSPVRFSSEQDQEACRIRDARAAELRAMRSNKK